MIVITGHLSVKPDSIDAVKAGATALMLATRKEAGCVTYKFAQEVEDPTVFWFIEEWETDEALSSHFTQPHMAEFGKVIGAAAAGAPVGHKYVVESKKSLF